MLETNATSGQFIFLYFAFFAITSLFSFVDVYQSIKLVLGVKVQDLFRQPIRLSRSTTFQNTLHIHLVCNDVETSEACAILHLIYTSSAATCRHRLLL